HATAPSAIFRPNDSAWLRSLRPYDTILLTCVSSHARAELSCRAFGCDRQPEAQAAEQRAKALKAWVATLREHLIKALPIQFAPVSNAADSLRFCHVAQGQEKHSRIAILKRGIEVCLRLGPILEQVNQVIFVWN